MIHVSLRSVQKCIYNFWRKLELILHAPRVPLVLNLMTSSPIQRNRANSAKTTPTNGKI